MLVFADNVGQIEMGYLLCLDLQQLIENLLKPASHQLLGLTPDYLLIYLYNVFRYGLHISSKIKLQH